MTFHINRTDHQEMCKPLQSGIDYGTHGYVLARNDKCALVIFKSHSAYLHRGETVSVKSSLKIIYASGHGETYITVTTGGRHLLDHVRKHRLLIDEHLSKGVTDALYDDTTVYIGEQWLELLSEDRIEEIRLMKQKALESSRASRAINRGWTNTHRIISNQIFQCMSVVDGKRRMCLYGDDGVWKEVTTGRRSDDPANPLPMMDYYFDEKS